MTRQVIIEIYADGSTKIDADGFKGQSCSLATKELELALAGDMNNVSDKRKPDYYQSTTPSQTQSN